MDQTTIERTIRQVKKDGAASRGEILRRTMERMGHDIDINQANRAASLRQDLGDAAESILDGIRNNARAELARILATRQLKEIKAC